MFGAVYYSEICLRRAWNATRRRPRPGSDPTASHPSLAVRKGLAYGGRESPSTYKVKIYGTVAFFITHKK